jgi:hypothetical protein
MSPALQQAPASPSAEERADEKVRARQGVEPCSLTSTRRSPVVLDAQVATRIDIAQLRHQRVSPVVALALALLLSRGIAASAIAPARALAKQL